MNELLPRFTNQQSFYGKAHEVYSAGEIKLYSYNTLVAKIDSEGMVIVYGTYSQTTLRHIKEFLKQHGYKAETKSQIENDYIY